MKPKISELLEAEEALNKVSAMVVTCNNSWNNGDALLYQNNPYIVNFAASSLAFTDFQNGGTLVFPYCQVARKGKWWELSELTLS